MRRRIAAAVFRQGNVVFWLVICLMVIIAIVALTLDGGRLLRERRNVQAAVDAAALAAAAKLRTGYCWEPDFTGDAVTAALNIAAANGYRSEDPQTKITVNIPPVSGEFAGMPQHAEVIIETDIPGSFSTLLTQNPPSIRAGAVAQSLRREVGLIVLKDTGKEVLFVNTNGTVDVQGAPIFVNSADPVAYHVTNSSTIIGDSHNARGNVVTSNGGSVVGPVQNNAAPQTNPLYCLPDINLVEYLTQNANQLVIDAGTIVLNPGIYKGGINIVGTGNLFLNPGTYIMDGGGFHYSGSGDLTAQGVTIVNTGLLSSDTIDIEGSGKVTITPPDTGTYAGISMFQPYVKQTLSISGNGNTKIEGIIFAPKAHVALSVLGKDLSTVMGGGYVTNTLSINGDGSFRVGAALNNPSPASVRLVE